MTTTAMIDHYAALSRAYADRGDGRLAQLAIWAADLELLQALLWENGLGEAPDPDVQLSAVGEAVLESLSHTVAEAGAETTPREAVERSRAAMVATFDESVHAMLTERFMPLDHLDGLRAAVAVPAERSVSERLAGRNPYVLVAELETTAVDCMAVAEVLADEGDIAAAVRQAWQADLAAFEAYLLTAALGAGDTALASVDLRWDHAASLGLPEPLESDDLEAAADRWRSTLVSVVSATEAETLRARFHPVPAS